MIHLSTLLKHYKRRDIQEEIIEAAKDKEVAVKYGDKGFGKRPDVLQHEKDVLEFAKNGATSFHCSEELWHNPLQLEIGMKKQELDALRKGWDLVLDVDCPWLEYSQIAADLLVHALRYHGIEHLGVKFSGNHGFHIAVPFEALPEKVHNKDTRLLFPDGPRKIAVYLQEMIRNHLSSRILEGENISQIMAKTGMKKEGLLKKGFFDPFALLKIDTVLISSRHMYRMPYSFNEKSGLISIPINPKKILEFDKNMAVAERVSVEHSFLPRKQVNAGEASKLLIQAFDFHPPANSLIEAPKSLRQKEEFSVPLQAVPEQYFPPCIQNISKGLSDGRKRAAFLLINFLSSLGWNYEQIESYLRSWNSRNPEPLREQYYLGQLRYHQQQKKQVLPPNCSNKAYMAGMGVCKPDSFCGARGDPLSQDFSAKIKNPVNYALKKQRLASLTKKSKKGE
ncbi:MAG: hypothetical protein QXT19_00445 [Candidatus Woesearchaeota archaeon]